MKTVQLSLATAKIMYNEGNAVKAFALEHYTESELTAKELPKTWEELKHFNGYYVNNSNACAENCGTMPARFENKNIFATKEQAEASIAMAQLSQLMVVYNDSWVPDWDVRNDKYCIHFNKNTIVTNIAVFQNYFLAFKTCKLRNEFNANFKDLIEQAKPLL